MRTAVPFEKILEVKYHAANRFGPVFAHLEKALYSKSDKNRIIHKTQKRCDMNPHVVNNEITECKSFRRYFMLCIFLFATSPSFAIDSLQVDWSTYIGGSDGYPIGGGDWNFADLVNEMVADKNGNLYIVGETKTTNLPGRTNNHTTESECAFVSKLNSEGIIQWSTYVGGSPAGNGCKGFGICLDENENTIFITGATPTSADFPKLLNPNWQSAGAFVTSLKTSDGSIQWSRLLTRNDYGNGNAICMHKNHLFITGAVGPWGELLNPKNQSSGGGDAFVYELTADGGVINCCFYGGSWGKESGDDLFIDDQDHIYLVGDIFWEYPSNNNYDYDLPKEINEWLGDQRDGFACKLNSDLDVQWSRYIGGKAMDWADYIFGDDKGSLWITGFTYSDNMEGEIIIPYNGSKWPGGDAYLMKIDNNGTIDWTSFANYSGSHLRQPKLTNCRKIITLRNIDVLMFDADLGYHQSFISYDCFMGPHCYEVKQVNDLFMDESMNIFICGYAASTCINFPNRNNEHSRQGFDGFVVKTNPKGHFFHFNDNAAPGWPVSKDHWSITDGKYKFIGSGGNIYHNEWYNTEFYNFIFEIQATKISGSSSGSYGINLRKNQQKNDNYQFGVYPNGNYFINYWVSGSRQMIVSETLSPAVKTGLGQCNSLAVTAQDSVLIFYMNGTQVHKIENSTTSEGILGIYATDTNEGDDVVEFDNVYISPHKGFPTAVLETNKTQVMPLDYALDNYPNPFNPVTTIKFSITKPYLLTIKIVDVCGREITTLLNEHKKAGHYSVQWNGKATSGSICPSGLYFCIMKTNEFSVRKKLMLVK